MVLEHTWTLSRICPSMEELKLPCVVRGYHAYMNVWDPYLGDTFTTKHERGNPHDKYAVAVLPVDSKTKPIVGHLPREISKECCLFILHGGLITEEVNGKRRQTIAACGGMEIPCELTFSHTKKKMLEKLKHAIGQKYQHTLNK